MATQTKPANAWTAFMEHLHNGEFDERINDAYDELRERRGAVDAAKALEARMALRKNMRVRVREDANMRNRSILGVEIGTIKAIKQTRAVVTLTTFVGKWMPGTEVTFPMSCLEEVK